ICTTLGSATVEIANSGNYSYVWHNSANEVVGSNSDELTDVAAGNYSVTVTSTATGCYATETVTVGNNPTIVTFSADATSPDCSYETGSVAVTDIVGTANYTVAWNGGSENGISDDHYTISNLGTGNYTITVTDANGCSATQSGLSVSVPNEITYSVSTVDQVCSTAGSITLESVSGGAGGYSYQWSNSVNEVVGNGTNVLSGVNAGVYNVTVTDARGCEKIDAITLNGSGGTVSFTLVAHETLCHETASGRIEVQGITGRSPYSISWSSAEASGNEDDVTASSYEISNIPAGNYTVVVTDADQCSYTSTANVGQAGEFNATVSLNSPLKCNGDKFDLIAEATGGYLGGGSEYSYIWSNDATTQLLEGLTVFGTYSVSVRDDNGCEATATINVEEPTAVQIAITATEISCHGETATITVSGEGGTGSYTGTGTFENITASATPYTYTIYDTNDCSASDNITITEPEDLTITLADIVDQTCSTQGSARLTITGGSGSLSYSWDGGDASTYTSAVTTLLGSGSHTVSVTDGNGCTATENVNIQNNSGMTVSLNSRQHTRCYEQDGGSFTLDFNNGTSPYEILTWNGETVNETNPSHTFSNLTAGNYGVTITDANGCTDNISVEVEDADEFTANASLATPIMCHGDSFDITVDANGGTLASGHEYTYAWSNGVNTQSQTGLTTYTTYTVTVRDDNSCEAISSVEAVNPSEVRIIITADEISCHGGTATITVSGEGGTGSYTGTGTFEDITASAMAYSYTITDGNGCSATDDIAITEPEELTVALSSIVSQTCETLGSVDFAISGGTGSISYSWDGGSANVYASATTEQLGSGSHTISVIDGNGCTATATVDIPNNSGMTLSPNPSQPARCFGENSGSIMIDFVNGTSPYIILWNGNLINETNDYHYFDNLTAGTYDVTVTDANGCSGNTSVEIGQPDDFVATASVTSTINCHDDAFDISASAQGGNGGYTYMWNGSVAGQSQSGLTEYRTYNVIVTDAEGCTATSSVTPENPQGIAITSIVADAIQCHGGTTVVNAYAGGGSGTLNYTWATEGVPAVNSQQITAPAGTYSLTVTDGNGCWISTTYVVDTPDEISIEITRTTEQYCTTLGEVQLAVGGGTGNLSYTWDGNTINPIVGSSIVSRLSAGTHTLTVTDGNGCTATLPVTIDYGAEMSVAASQPDSVRCFGETNGEFTISMNDGFAPYTIVWNNGTITEYSDLHTFANLSAGTYGITVTDAHNCMEMISVEVGAPERLMVLSSAERILCHGESAEVTVSATGGTLPYQNTGIYNLVAGEYDYMVTDANGCTSSTHVSLLEPTSISVNAVAVNALCFGGNGNATLMISGGTNPYSVVWQDNSTGLDNTHIPVNTNFGYTVTDLNGCTYDGAVAVGQPQQLSLDLSVTPVSCFGLEDARVGVSHIGGGTLPYNYLWSNGNTMNSLVGVGAGTYSLLVTDANGCTISSTAVVTQPEALNVSVVSSNVECGISNGSLSANVYGGSQPYVYYWSNGGTSALLDNVSAGAYSLTVTDANGCSATSSSQINVAGMLSASIVEQSPISCFGMTDATLVAVVEQAQPPVMYQWNNGQNGSTLFGLGTGMYIVTVTDGWGCQGVANYMLYSPTAMIMSSQVTDAKCSNTSEGAISLTVGGGRPPYSYLWTTGSTEPNLEDLRVGSYGVLVTDMSGCTMQENFVISAPTTISVEADVTDITCYGKKDGRVEINVTGGVEPYAYGFYMGNTVSHNGSVYEHLRPGVYNISVSDANGCGKSISVAVGQPERLGVNSMVSAPSCKDLHDATVEIVTAGGTAPFTYTLGTYTSDSSTFINLHPGLYSAVVTDANGCSNEISEIIVPESKLDCLRIPNVITPNGDGVNDEWIIENIELFPEAHIYVYNRWGQLLYHDRGNGERWDGSYRGHFVPSGVYMYIIKLESVEETYEGTVTVLY
ncbi:MAG: gliding motility-associated C-terminal domain-containing protein, partial [Bacteroidales bacterium]|nr:gliding motility-associated C-terminal domain-containing protein [Bacteroidales bacterium]